MNGWYEVKATRKDVEGNVHHGWIAITTDGQPFFWHRFHRNDATPSCCCFTSFAKAEQVAEQFQDVMNVIGASQHHEVHFPTRRDLQGRKRPLLKGDCEILKSA